MEWGEISADWWEMSREKTKADRAQRIPLSKLALELIGSRKRKGQWVFPTMKGEHLQAHALSHALRHNDEHFGIAHFTPHDLRRTCASHLAAIGVERFIIGRVLNHADRAITGVYDRYAYDAEKRRALEKWERKLRAVIGQPDAAEVVAIR